MDALVQAELTATLLWAAGLFIGTPLIIFLVGLIGLKIADGHEITGVTTAAVVAWVVGVVWAIVCIVFGIIHLVALIIAIGQAVTT